ncbi:MAG TPA: hypothetical protein PLA50_15925, partial [Bacteroidia bacterium]|nr:hypothetical protein [Bacteroidia bacterium]
LHFREAGSKSGMSDQTEAAGENGRENRGSPAPGCFILAAILTVFGGLAILYTVVGNYQRRTIATFTEETAALYPIDAPDAATAEAATAKLRQIAQFAAAGRAERILFTAADLNTLIATLDAAEGFRGNTRVQKITADGIVAEMSQPMRKGIIDKGVHYLNAVFVLEPELRVRTVAFKVLSITPTTGEIPAGFVQNFSALDLYRLDPENPAIKANIGSIASVYTEDGQLVVETKIKIDE